LVDGIAVTLDVMQPEEDRVTEGEWEDDTVIEEDTVHVTVMVVEGHTVTEPEAEGEVV
jgi:hypothetical protein